MSSASSQSADPTDVGGPPVERNWLARIEQIAFRPSLLYVLLAAGVVARLKCYADNPSLWLDEACVALNLLSRSFTELAEPLDYRQVAPLGFLVLVKSAVSMLGTNELVWRLVPVITSILGLVWFYQLTGRWLTPGARLAAIAIFASATKVITYSGQLKQYSGDITIAIGLLLLTERWLERKDGMRGLALAAGGGLAVWFSHPAIFTLAGIGTSLFVAELVQRNGRVLRMLVTVGAAWIASFGALYALTLSQARAATDHQWLLDYWGERSFPRFPPMSMTSLEWYRDKPFELMSNPAGLHFEGLAFGLLVMGVVVLYRKNRLRLAILVAPLGFAFVAAVLHQYPFADRLLLFHTPSLYVLIAIGLSLLFTHTYRRLPLLPLGVVMLLFLMPADSMLRWLVWPRANSHIREAMQFVADHHQEGDAVYINEYGSYGFRYYQQSLGLQHVTPLVGPVYDIPWPQHLEGLDRLRGENRAWVFIDSPRCATATDLYCGYLDSIGKRLDAAEFTRTSLYLYDVTEGKPSDSLHLPEAVHP